MVVLARNPLWCYDLSKGQSLCDIAMEACVSEREIVDKDAARGEHPGLCHQARAIACVEERNVMSGAKNHWCAARMEMCRAIADHLLIEANTKTDGRCYVVRHRE